MADQTFLVYLDSAQAAPELLNVAMQIGQNHAGHLIGLYVVPRLELSGYDRAPLPSELATNHVAHHRAISDAIRTQFEKTTGSQGLAAEWREISAKSTPVSQVIAEIVSTVDMAVVGQKGEYAENTAQRELPQRIVMSSGRPVILVPEKGTFNRLGRNIIVAWDGSVPATRAVFDSIPLLQNAESVLVSRITLGNEDRQRLHSDSSELSSTLSRHGISVTLSETDAKAEDVGKTLLSQVSSQKADLLVMGAYGHSRMREFLLGGTTKSILRDMNVPVLMSH